jgi:hypothetical protein
MAKAKVSSKSSSKSSSSRKRSSQPKRGSKRLFEKSANIGPQVHIDGYTRPFLDQDNPALVGHFARVTKGEHSGRYGVVDQVAATDSNGWPTEVLFVTRDDDSAVLRVNYDDLEAARAGQR